MHWKDEGYLLSKSTYNENSIIISTFTLNHGKCSGIVYGGNSRKQKKNYQIGNKISLSCKSKGENRIGYFNIELVKPIAPLYFDDKKKSICILSSISILKILLPERQINKKIYLSFEKLTNQFNYTDWIRLYILWELFIIQELGFGIDLSDFKHSRKLINNTIKINDKNFKIPKLLLERNNTNISKFDVKEALIFNKNLLMENLIIPNRLSFPKSRIILEKYYN